MIYGWVRGSRIEAKAQDIGERIEQMRTVNAGVVTPELLVDDGRAEESPLHPCFEWDDTIAAERYRLDQARLVLRSLTVSIADDRRVPIRAFVCVERTEAEGRAYVAIHDALRDDDFRTQVLANAVREVQAWRQRYSRLRELANIFAAVDQFELPTAED
jgi:hypothetical protein